MCDAGWRPARTNSALVHDDYVMADALVAILDKLDWEFRSDTLIIQAPDPLDDMSHFG
jgi:hypothetical protein